jgi:hypothetical protein
MLLHHISLRLLDARSFIQNLCVSLSASVKNNRCVCKSVSMSRLLIRVCLRVWQECRHRPFSCQFSCAKQGQHEDIGSYAASCSRIQNLGLLNHQFMAPASQPCALLLCPDPLSCPPRSSPMFQGGLGVSLPPPSLSLSTPLSLSLSLSLSLFSLCVFVCLCLCLSMCVCVCVWVCVCVSTCCQSRWCRLGSMAGQSWARRAWTGVSTGSYPSKSGRRSFWIPCRLTNLWIPLRRIC